MCYLLSSACSQSCKACKLIQFVEYDCYSTTRGIFFQPQSIILIHVGEILVCFSLQQKMGREVFHQHTWPLYSEMAYHLMAQFISDSEWFLQYTHKLEFFFFKEHYFFPPPVTCMRAYLLHSRAGLRANLQVAILHENVLIHYVFSIIVSDHRS